MTPTDADPPPEVPPDPPADAVDPAPDAASDAAGSALARARADARARGDSPRRDAGPGRSGQTGRRRRRPVTSEDTYSGSGPDARDPQPLGGVVGRLVDDRQWGEPLAVGVVIARWGEVVGPEVAEHTEPVRLEDGELVVQADSTTWATQLKLLASSVQRRLDEVLGASAVRTVTVLGPSAPSWKKGRRSVPGRGPRDTYG